jgi:heme exporter protein B
MNALWTLIARDLRVAVREGGAIGTPLGFYLVVVAMLPLGLGPDLNLLSRIAPGILWTALLLAALLSSERIFQNDQDDGALDLMALGPLPLELVALAKICAHWLTTALPLTITTPLLALMLNLPASGYLPLIATMLVGTLGVSAIAAIGAALTLGLRKGGLLIALLVLPFYVPVLIFGVITCQTATMGPGSLWPPFAVLAAISIASLALAPIAVAAALRVQIE